MKKMLLFVAALALLCGVGIAQSDADNIFAMRKSLSNVLLKLTHSDSHHGSGGLWGKRVECNVALVSQSCVVLPKQCNPTHAKPNPYRFVSAIYAFNKAGGGKRVEVSRNYESEYNRALRVPVSSGDDIFEYIVMNLSDKDKASVPNVPVKIMVFNDDARKDAFMKTYAKEVEKGEYGITVKGKNNELVIVALNTYEKGSEKDKFKVSHVSKNLAAKLQYSCGAKFVSSSLNDVVIEYSSGGYYMADPATGKKVFAQNEENKENLINSLKGNMPEIIIENAPNLS